MAAPVPVFPQQFEAMLNFVRDQPHYREPGVEQVRPGESRAEAARPPLPWRYVDPQQPPAPGLRRGFVFPPPLLPANTACSRLPDGRIVSYKVSPRPWWESTSLEEEIVVTEETAAPGRSRAFLLA